MLDTIMLVLVLAISLIATMGIPDTVPFRVGYVAGFFVAAIWLLIKFILTARKYKKILKESANNG